MAEAEREPKREEEVVDTNKEGAGTKEEGAEDGNTKEEETGEGNTKKEEAVVKRARDVKANTEGKEITKGEKEGEGGTVKGEEIGKVSTKGGGVKAKEESEGEEQQNSCDRDDWQTPPPSPGEMEDQMETDEAGQSVCGKTMSDSDSSSEGEPWGRPWKREDKSPDKRKIRIPKLRSSWSSRDTLMYRRQYPGKRDNPRLTSNYEFYTNKRPSYPNGDLIDNIHQTWWGNYQLLEAHHGYIQWLFPIRESGMNFYSEELQLHEIEKILADDKAAWRVLRSYEMMLDFYGMKLKDSKTGELERADHWQDRFWHLNHSMHNYLRITRILKSLGEFQYEHFKGPFVRFVLHEAIVEQTLTRTLDSCMNYWVEVIRDDKEREAIRTLAKKLAQNS